MDRRTQRAAPKREGVHTTSRRTEPPTARAALGESREELRLRWSQRKGDTRKPLRRKKPVNCLSLHAWSRLGRGLSKLLDGSGSLQQLHRPSECARRVDGCDLA